MKQRDFGWLAEMKQPVLAPDNLMAHVKNEFDAIRLTWDLRKIRYTQADASARLEMAKSHLSNILSGQKYLPADLRVPFMWLCGNTALRQWEDRQMAALGLDFELLEAERKLQEIRARRAA